MISRKLALAVFCTAVTVFGLQASNAAAQNVIWSKQLPSNVVAITGDLLDVDRANPMPDVVVVGVTSSINSASPNQPGAIGLNSWTGDYLWTTALGAPSANRSVVSVQALGDRNNDKVEEALVAVRGSGSTPGGIQYYVLDGANGSILTGSLETITNAPSAPVAFEPIRGDFNGDMKDDNYIYRKQNHPLRATIEAIE